jgi:hypothetical protein
MLIFFITFVWVIWKYSFGSYHVLSIEIFIILSLMKPLWNFKWIFFFSSIKLIIILIVRISFEINYFFWTYIQGILSIIIFIYNFILVYIALLLLNLFKNHIIKITRLIFSYLIFLKLVFIKIFVLIILIRTKSQIFLLTV